MALVEPDGRFRRLAQVLGIRTVVHDAVMHVRTPRVVGCPPDNGQMVRCQLELWPFGDLDALGSLGRRKYLSGGWVGRVSPAPSRETCCPCRSSARSACSRAA